MHQGGSRGLGACAAAGSGSASCCSAGGPGSNASVAGHAPCSASFSISGRRLRNQARPKWRRRSRQPRKASPGTEELPPRAKCSPIICSATRPWPNRDWALSATRPSACSSSALRKAFQRSCTDMVLPGEASMRRWSSATSAIGPLVQRASGDSRPSAARDSPQERLLASCSGRALEQSRRERKRARASPVSCLYHLLYLSLTKNILMPSRNGSPSNCFSQSFRSSPWMSRSSTSLDTRSSASRSCSWSGGNGLGPSEIMLRHFLPMSPPWRILSKAAWGSWPSSSVGQRGRSSLQSRRTRGSCLDSGSTLCSSRSQGPRLTLMRRHQAWSCWRTSFSFDSMSAAFVCLRSLQPSGHLVCCRFSRKARLARWSLGADTPAASTSWSRLAKAATGLPARRRSQSRVRALSV
mmetsp:Transcript_46024/g.144216  ORF Transcript_46024/g.144216 Transcript_46024/m.144216 type:complete len:410 (+) Transcript_46024:216-1445(+)